MPPRIHTGRIAKTLRVLLTAALLLQCAAFSAAAADSGHSNRESLITATIPAAALPSGLRIAGRDRAGTGIPHFPSGAGLVDVVRIPAAISALGLLRPAPPSAPSSAPFPHWSGRSPPAASV
ncbi:MAG: hypothetical protein JST11_31290 [Acidobacteria bacterium]|nr:hypothetical protein [Acidobacteriota bacterium]